MHDDDDEHDDRPGARALADLIRRAMIDRGLTSRLRARGTASEGAVSVELRLMRANYCVPFERATFRINGRIVRRDAAREALAAQERTR